MVNYNMIFFHNKFKLVKPLIYKSLPIAILLSVWISPLSYAQQPTIHEYQLKAVFLYNFGHFVSWPPTVFKDRFAPFRICVLGEDPFRNLLDLAVKDEKRKGRVVKVQRLSRVEETTSCHIVFISRSEKSALKRIFAFLRQRPILTVSDIKHFARDGGMIQFVNRGKHVRFYMNRHAEKTAGMRINARLLMLARLIFYK